MKSIALFRFFDNGFVGLYILLFSTATFSNWSTNHQDYLDKRIDCQRQLDELANTNALMNNFLDPHRQWQSWPT